MITPALLGERDGYERVMDGWVDATHADAFTHTVVLRDDDQAIELFVVAEPSPSYLIREARCRPVGGALDPALAASRFWYHAEVFSAARLATLLRGRRDIDRDRFSTLQDPALVCYYLFFPGHEQPLEGCDGMAARRWASCA